MLGDLVFLAVGGELLSIEIAEDDVVDVGVVLEEGDERAGEGANAAHANSNSHIVPLTRLGTALRSSYLWTLIQWVRICISSGLPSLPSIRRPEA